jgi:hypothetical protein
MLRQPRTMGFVTCLSIASVIGWALSSVPLSTMLSNDGGSPFGPHCFERPVDHIE